MEKNQKKENVFVRFGKKIAKLCKDTVGELKKVAWLPKNELVKSFCHIGLYKSYLFQKIADHRE